MKKQIDFETLCGNCSQRLPRKFCKCTSNWADKETCPIWNRLPDVPEQYQSKSEWLEYEGY